MFIYIFTLSPSLVLEHQEIFAWSEFKFLHLHFLLLEIACHARFATIPLPYGSKLCLVVWLQHIMQMMWIPNLFLKYFSKMLVLLFFWRYLYSFLLSFLYSLIFSQRRKNDILYSANSANIQMLSVNAYEWSCNWR